MNQDAVATIAQIIEETPWGDVEGSVQAIDFFIARLEFVLAPQFRELASPNGWPAWLDGRVSDEGSLDPARLNHSETLLLIAALVHDIKISWRENSGLASSANVLEACLTTVHHQAFLAAFNAAFSGAPQSRQGDPDIGGTASDPGHI